LGRDARSSPAGSPRRQAPSRNGYVEGPLGFPVRESVAGDLDALLKAQPKDSAYEYRRLARSAAKVDVKAGVADWLDRAMGRV